MIATLDKYGRIIIPKYLRDLLGITTETNLHVEEDGKRIIIEPIHNVEQIVEKEGVLVYTGELNGDLDRILLEDRQKREKKLLKKG